MEESARVCGDWLGGSYHSTEQRNLLLIQYAAVAVQRTGRHLADY
jgi:hypothetical protein